jgi:hypothetical protein
VIIAPKFSEFIALSILAFIHNSCLLNCIYLVIVCFTLGISLPKPLFEDVQEQVFDESKVFFSGQQGKCT